MMETETKNTQTFYNTEIPSDWTVKKAFEICDFIVPGRDKPELSDEGIPWITTPDLNGTYISLSLSNLYVSRDYVKKNNLKIVPVNSVIMTCVGDLGIVALTKNEIIINQQLHAFLPSKLIDSHFLLNSLESQRKYFEKVATKTAVPYLNKDNCNSTPILLPPLPEQKAIAQVLSTADSAINTTEKLIAQKELRKKWLMQQLLTGKKRLKGFVGEWKEKRLGEVAEIDKLTLSSQTPPDYSFQYISLSDVDAGTAEIKSERIIFKNSPSRARRIVQKGDVLLATVRPNLQAFLIIRDDVKDLIASTGFAVITCKKINNEFLFQYLFSKGLMNQIEAFLTGSNYPAINSSDVKQLKFPYPSIEEQAAIAQVLQAADKEISLLKAKAEKLREQKKGLMQQLLTGKVRLKIKE